VISPVSQPCLSRVQRVGRVARAARNAQAQQHVRVPRTTSLRHEVGPMSGRLSERANH
jgi:hypothetical protein